MPKQWAVKGLRRKQRVRKAARIILRAKARATLAHADLVRVGDVEAIHDMRVNSKRWREALRLLLPGLPRKSAKAQLARVDALNDALGVVRERDVLLQQVEDLLAQLPPEAQDAARGALAPLRERGAAERDGHHCRLVEFLDGWREKRYGKEFARFARALRRWRGRRGQAASRDFARQHLAACVARVLEREPAARDPEAFLAFHRLRLAVKRLRYTIEPFWTILPRSVRAAYPPICSLAETMGKTHDCDVLAETLRRETEGHDWRTAALQPLCEVLAADRRRLYQQSAELLDQVVSSGLAQGLANALG